MFPGIVCTSCVAQARPIQPFIHVERTKSEGTRGRQGREMIVCQCWVQMGGEKQNLIGENYRYLGGF